MTGVGTFFWIAGESYEGTLVDGDYQGTGIYRWRNGSIYEGKFVDNLPNGLGSIYTTNGNFEGIWVDWMNTEVGVFYPNEGDGYTIQLVDGEWVID